MSEPRTIDFREGCWGHTMHGFTWQVLPDRVEGFLRKRRHPRVSVMVHTRSVSEGDQVVYTGQSGNDRIATVAEVRPCWNPRDMFKLVLEDIRALPSKDPDQ